MKTLFTFLASTLLSFQLISQTKIDTAFSFQTDPNKKLSIYIPSSYNGIDPNGLMLALHPWNTRRWNAKSWRDTLTFFAEKNKLILLCPDGGSDGQVDDPIDLAFTTAMLDSIKKWYKIDTRRTYCMGFSWGGKTTYTYGLSKPQTFCGYIPIGAVINIRELALVADSIKGKPIYIIHGSNDAATTSYTPIKKEMEKKGGIVNSLLMQGVGHTIDFANRNKILNTAFTWVDSVCTIDSIPISVSPVIEQTEIKIYPNPIKSGANITIEGLKKKTNAKLASTNGKTIWQGAIKNQLAIPSHLSGNYLLILNTENGETIKRLQITP